METKFFTNKEESGTLFEKMKRLFRNMPTHEFLAVSGYFRSSGYFKLRDSATQKAPAKMRILVGIDVDRLTAKYNKVLNSAKAAGEYSDFIEEDIRQAHYSEEVENGIRQMVEDLKSGRLEMRLYKEQNLHAKFYIFLPEGFCPEKGGHVIMGSSNLTDSGLGTTRPPRYEMNVDIDTYNDVDFCRDEFEKLWADGVPLTAEYAEEAVKKTYVGQAPTPYEIFVKVLIDKFGAQVEDGFNFTMPEGIKKLSYQTDAAIQGYQTILQHNGVILADVVGLGKTIIATMIVKRFMEANGKNTKTLIVTPPAVRDNWLETFKMFGLERNTHFQIVNNGSLHKIINGEKDGFWPKERFDLVIVDEAHTFRSGGTCGYSNLQTICKSRPDNNGFLKRDRKGVLLVSATPLNNRPEDIKNLLLLFQDSQNCSIEGVPNLDNYFSGKIREYKKLIKDSKGQTLTDHTELTRRADALNEGIRADVLSKVTIRRTRTNILRCPAYKADLDAQGIKFPEIDPPREVKYGQMMDFDTKDLFADTFNTFSKYDPDEEAEDFDNSIINYGSHRALEFLIPEKADEIFGGRVINGKHIAQTLSAIYRTLMIKRLESSFDAFRKSLDRFTQSSEDMLTMIKNDDIVLNLRDEGEDYQEPEDGVDGEAGDDEGQTQGNARHFKAADFDPKFESILKSDLNQLRRLKKKWKLENDNPKWECLKKKMSEEMLDPGMNPSGKIVIFSEFVDTLDSLLRLFREDLGRKDVLMVTSQNRKIEQQRIRANFDANLPADKRQDDIKILLTSDALSEGVNLHRANVIVNYDSPWNATRLMQRIGRVNRIGSEAGHIVNYMFYPTDESENKISLAARSLVKLQSFHSALGEDSQIFSHEEIVRQFELFNKDVRDNVDKDLEMRRLLSEIFETDRDLYEKIKALPAKSRTWRSRSNRADGAEIAPRQTLTYLSSNGRKEFYQTLPGQKPHKVSFQDAVDILRAEPAEPTADHSGTGFHYAAVKDSIKAYQDSAQAARTATIAQKSVNAEGNRESRILGSARKFLRSVMRIADEVAKGSEVAKEATNICERLEKLLKMGTYSQLDNNIDRLRKSKGRDDDAIKANMDAIVSALAKLSGGIETPPATQPTAAEPAGATSQATPEVVISESFVD